MTFIVRTDIEDPTSDVFVHIIKSADVAGLTSVHPNFQARAMMRQSNLPESRFVFIESKPLLMMPILTHEEEHEYAVDEKTFVRKYLTNTEWLFQRKYLVLDGAMRRLLCIRYVPVFIDCTCTIRMYTLGTVQICTFGCYCQIPLRT